MNNFLSALYSSALGKPHKILNFVRSIMSAYDRLTFAAI